MPALIKVAYMKRLVDEPEERKVHKRRIPTIGGIIIFAATLFSYLLWYPVNNIPDFSELNHALNDFKFIGASMLILFFIGVKDDIVGTAPMKKLIGHLIVAFILVMMADIRITSFHGILGIRELPVWASVLLSVFTYTVIVNAFNLIDGIDGLAAGIGTIATLAYGTFFFLSGGIELAALSFALAGALVGFLIFNFQPAKIFMGDSGSLTIGLIVSVLSIKMIEFDKDLVPQYLKHISKPVFAMAVLVYPLIDTLRIFIYRAAKGVSPFSADKNHIHHRFIEIGFSHRTTVIILYAYSIGIVLLASTLRFEPNASFIIVGVLALGLLLTPLYFIKNKVKAKLFADYTKDAKKDELHAKA